MKTLRSFVVALVVSMMGAASAATDDGYPTVARVDYVLGCMAANGNTREVMAKCACSIDVIAGLLPYAEYERAETVLGMQAGNIGERGAIFRDPPGVRLLVEELRRAQAEANLQCF